MTTKLGVLACAPVLIVATPAGAATLVNGYSGRPSVAGRLSRWLEHDKMPRPTGPIEIHRDANMAVACDGGRATACSEPGQIWIGGFSWHAQFVHERLWNYQNWRSQVWDPTCEAAGFDPTPHEFRHSWTTHLRAAGVDPADLAAIAGHTVETATRVYTHATGRSYDQIRSVIG